MLNNFFTINLPYGLFKSENDTWVPFNREYMPLGYNNTGGSNIFSDYYIDIPYNTKYLGLTEEILMNLADHFERDENNQINKIYLYVDISNPTSQNYDSDAVWNKYFNKIRTLSKLKVK